MVNDANGSRVIEWIQVGDNISAMIILDATIRSMKCFICGYV